MQPLNDYSDAYDSEGEREHLRDCAIDAMSDAIIKDRDDFTDLVSCAIERDDVSPAEVIALLWASRLPIRPEWATDSAIEYALQNIDISVSCALKEKSEERVDNEYAEQQRQRREGSGE